MKKRRKNKVPLCLTMGIFFVSSILGAAPLFRAQAAIADHVVINEIHIDGIAGSGGTDDDWVELYNPTAVAVNLAGWSIQKFSSTGSSGFNQALSGTIPARGYFLIVRNGATTAQALKDQADLLASNSFGLASDNIVYLANNATAIIPGATNPNIVDLVGYGTVSYYEGASSAIDITETKSLSRVPDGEDTDENFTDLIQLDTPTPRNSTYDNNSNLSGTVLLTVTPDDVPVQNITPTGANIVFQVNAAGTAQVRYGLTGAYDLATLSESVQENTPKTISLAGLACGQTYHYSIYAANTAGTENDATADATFATLPCGIRIDSLAMTKATAKANNQFTDGWQWEFNITVWDMAETALKMKFAQWTGAASLDAGNNMEYSVDNGAAWTSIAANDAYPAAGAAIGAIDNSADGGRQVKILVRMKVPLGTRTGTYNSSYGILTE